MKMQQTATPVTSLSPGAKALSESFEGIARYPFLVSPYNDLPSDDCLILVNGISFQGSEVVTRLAAELGWTTPTENSVRWSASWLKELKKTGRLGRFYGFVKNYNRQAAELRAKQAA